MSITSNNSLFGTEVIVTGIQADMSHPDRADDLIELCARTNKPWWVNIPEAQKHLLWLQESPGIAIAKFHERVYEADWDLTLSSIYSAGCPYTFANDLVRSSKSASAILNRLGIILGEIFKQGVDRFKLDTSRESASDLIHTTALFGMNIQMLETKSEMSGGYTSYVDLILDAMEVISELMGPIANPASGPSILLSLAELFNAMSPATAKRLCEMFAGSFNGLFMDSSCIDAMMALGLAMAGSEAHHFISSDDIVEVLYKIGLEKAGNKRDKTAALLGAIRPSAKNVDRDGNLALSLITKGLDDPYTGDYRAPVIIAIADLCTIFPSINTVQVQELLFGYDPRQWYLFTTHHLRFDCHPTHLKLILDSAFDHLGSEPVSLLPSGIIALANCLHVCCEHQTYWEVLTDRISSMPDDISRMQIAESSYWSLSCACGRVGPGITNIDTEDSWIGRVARKLGRMADGKHPIAQEVSNAT